jgi:selenocysteine-specific elongation factor
MTTDRLLIVLNKTDMLPADNRDVQVKKAEERVRRGLKGTKFAETPMVAVAACPGAEEGAPPLGMTQLVRTSLLPYDISMLRILKWLRAYQIDTLREMTELPRRSTDGPFLLSVDHCFPVKGQGTVLTGTVLSGAVKVNDTIELPELKLQKKVKSLQVPITFSTSAVRVRILPQLWRRCFTSRCRAPSKETGWACASLSWTRSCWSAVWLPRPDRW